MRFIMKKEARKTKLGVCEKTLKHVGTSKLPAVKSSPAMQVRFIRKRAYCNVLAMLALSLLVGQCCPTNDAVHYMNDKSTEKQPVPNNDFLHTFVENELAAVRRVRSPDGVALRGRGEDRVLIHAVSTALEECAQLKSPASWHRQSCSKHEENTLEDQDEKSESASSGIPSMANYATLYLAYRLIVVYPGDLFAAPEEPTALGKVLLRYLDKSVAYKGGRRFVSVTSFSSLIKSDEKEKYTPKQAVIIMKKIAETLLYENYKIAAAHYFAVMDAHLAPITEFIDENNKKLFSQLQGCFLDYRLFGINEACRQVLYKLGLNKKIALRDAFIANALNRYASCTSEQEFLDALCTIYASAFTSLSGQIHAVISAAEWAAHDKKSVDEAKLRALMLLNCLLTRVQLPEPIDKNTILVPDELFIHQKKDEKNDERCLACNEVAQFFTEEILESTYSDKALEEVRENPQKAAVVVGLVHLAQEVLQNQDELKKMFMSERLAELSKKQWEEEVKQAMQDSSARKKLYDEFSTVLKEQLFHPPQAAFSPARAAAAGNTSSVRPN